MTPGWKPRQRAPNRSFSIRATLVAVSVFHLALDRPDRFLRLLVRIHVHHPAEDLGTEGASRLFASFLRSDRTEQAELRVFAEVRILLSLGRGAEIRVLMPLRDAERNARIQLLHR